MSDLIERRRLLQLGAAAGAAGAAGSVSCAGLGSVATAGKLLETKPLSAPDLKKHLAVMDRGLLGISKRSLSKDLLPKAYRDKAWRASLTAEDSLGRKALRSLYFSAMVNDLPAATQAHPEVQRRVTAMAPELDDAIFTTAGALKSMSKDEQRGLQKFLKRRPDTGMEIAELFEGQAKDLGLPLSRRLQTRAMMSNVGWRLRAQPPSLLIDEYVTKLQKVAAQSGQAEQLKRHFAHAASSAAFWSHQRRVASLESPPGYERVKAPAPKALEKERTKKPGPGQGQVNAGLVMLGMSAAALITGGVMLGPPLFQFAGAFVLTAGGVLLVTGLVTLIVGAVINAKAKP